MTDGTRRPTRRRSVEGDEQRTLKGAFHKFLSDLVRGGAPLRFRKNWGGRLTGSGEPDYTGCARGLYWTVELKHPGLDDVAGSRPSPAQAVILDEIRRAGGRTLCTNRLWVAKAFITSLLRGPVMTERHAQFMQGLAQVLSDESKSIHVGDTVEGSVFYGGQTVRDIAHLVTELSRGR